MSETSAVSERMVFGVVELRPHLNDGGDSCHGSTTTVEQRMRRIAKGVGGAHGCAVTVSYSREFVPLLNDAAATDTAVAAAARVCGPEAVSSVQPPIPASEDFARFLAVVPGNFAVLGNGVDSAPLHSPLYDFNDEGLAYGVRYFVSLVRLRLPVGPSPHP